MSATQQMDVFRQLEEAVEKCLDARKNARNPEE
jgi:hypothetical protein